MKVLLACAVGAVCALPALALSLAKLGPFGPWFVVPIPSPTPTPGEVVQPIGFAAYTRGQGNFIRDLKLSGDDLRIETHGNMRECAQVSQYSLSSFATDRAKIGKVLMSQARQIAKCEGLDARRARNEFSHVRKAQAFLPKVLRYFFGEVKN